MLPRKLPNVTTVHSSAASILLIYQKFSGECYMDKLSPQVLDLDRLLKKGYHFAAPQITD